MAVETKWFLVGVLILLASTRTNSLQISTISAPANLRTDLVVNYDTRLGLSNAENFNVTIRNWRTPRRVTFERDAFSFATFSRYGFYSRSNLFHIDKLGLQREHSPNEYSRSNFQQFRKVRKELPSDISRILLGSSFRSRVIVDQNLGRHVYQNEFKKFRLGEIRKNENIHLYDFHFVERVTKEYFHRFEREQKFVFRNDVNTLFRKFADIKANAKVAEGKDREWIGIRKGVLRPSGVNVKPFLQYLSNWYAVTLSSIADISKYLVTIVAGLFCFDIIGPVPSMKQARKNELRNFVALLYKWQGVY